MIQERFGEKESMVCVDSLPPHLKKVFELNQQLKQDLEQFSIYSYMFEFQLQTILNSVLSQREQVQEQQMEEIDRLFERCWFLYLELNRGHQGILSFVSASVRVVINDEKVREVKRSLEFVMEHGCVFAGLTQNNVAGFYHSLVVEYEKSSIESKWDYFLENWRVLWDLKKKI